MAICCTILMPVCRACQLFLLWHTAFRKGSSAGMPSADATTLNARAVVLRTYLRAPTHPTVIDYPHLLVCLTRLDCESAMSGFCADHGDG